MSIFRNINVNTDNFGYTVAGSQRVAQLTTLFDGKMLNQDNTLIFDNVGTGTGTYSNNMYNMSVTSGQYFIKQAKRFSPYFSGKPQFIEETFDNFQYQTGVIKRFGYFSSNAVAPYNSNLDGVYIESDGVNSTYRLVVVNDGTETLNKVWTDWDNYTKVSSYDWSKFTVSAIDFLWLGGAILRLFIKVGGEFVLAHTFNYAGTNTGTFMKSPNQPVRYEIRSTTGTGSFKYICSQVSTEGSINEEGFNGADAIGHIGISLATIGTKYPIMGIKKRSTHRDVSSKVTNIAIFTSSNSDILYWTLELTPTITGTFTYANYNNSAVQTAKGNGTATVTTVGKILASGYVCQNEILPGNLFDKDFLTYLGINLDNTAEAIVLCATPVTTAVISFGALMFKDSTH